MANEIWEHNWNTMYVYFCSVNYNKSAIAISEHSWTTVLTVIPPLEVEGDVFVDRLFFDSPYLLSYHENYIEAQADMVLKGVNGAAFFTTR